MIRYALRCDKAHDFESWFQNSAAYDKQAKRGLVTCPICGSEKVEKTIMTPQVAATTRGRKTKGETAQTPQAALVSPEMAELRAKLKALHEEIASNADNVGENFPEEARKIHYGEIEARPIYGQAKPEEAKELIEEGVEILPIPGLPDDRN